MDVVSHTEARSQIHNRRSAGAKAIFWANRNQKDQAAHLIGWLILRRDAQFKMDVDNFVGDLRRKIGFPEKAKDGT